MGNPVVIKVESKIKVKKGFKKKIFIGNIKSLSKEYIEEVQNQGFELTNVLSGDCFVLEI